MSTRILPPLDLPPNAPDGAKAKAAEFALSLADVARCFGVSKQSVYEWATIGRRGPKDTRSGLPCLRIPSGSKQEPLRFRLVDAMAFADEHKLQFDPARLPLELQRRLKVGAYEPGAEPFPTVEDESISESQAAVQLGVSRTTLRQRRLAGKLNPALLMDAGRYSQLNVHRVLDGSLELKREPTISGREDER